METCETVLMVYVGLVIIWCVRMHTQTKYIFKKMRTAGGGCLKSRTGHGEQRVNNKHGNKGGYCKL